MVRNGDTGDNPTENEVKGEVVSSETASTFTEEARRGMESIADVLAAAGGSVVSITDVLGDGFRILEDKAALLEVQFVVVEYGLHKGDNGEFSTLHVITEDGEKLIVNDGSTGIHAQCEQLVKKMGKVAPLLVPNGLRVSEYDYEDESGKKKRAKTYYLSTAK